MSATYKQFLTAPNSSLLAPNATLLYITTTTTINGPTDIIKHLNTQRNQLKKKKEDILDVVEGRDAIAAEIETSLEFVTSGGAYLPGLDDNFLADRTVHLPIMHVVNFDSEGKIAQIRQSWDQGSLLKQLDIIGKSGRNWPIRDSQEQIKMITRGLKATGKVTDAPDTNELINRSRGSSTNALRDPHASLSLFAPREQQAEEGPARSVVSPYAGTRPQQRSFNDIMSDEPADEPASPSAGRDRVAPKIGAGKNFQPSRLFDADEHAHVPDSPEEKTSPEKFIRPNPKKFQHFDFADGSDPQDTPKPAEGRPKAGKHDSSWGFEDFVTPQKVKPTKTLRTQDVRHWDTDVGHTDLKDTPAARPVQQKPRRDAEPHFEFQDDGPDGQPRPAGRPKGAAHNTGLHLYENNLYSEDGKPLPGTDSDQALGNITNLNNRHKDFDPHFAMSDDSPSQQAGLQQRPGVSDARKKAVNMMNANWESYDRSPASQKENIEPAPTGKAKGGIHIAGDGMGSRKAVEDQDGDKRGINIAGDGMGGRKGTNRNWLYGGDDDEEDTPKTVPPKGGSKPAGLTAAQKSFWDF
ncbi:hypothetical protein K4K52_005495 [Colletotrichum sp. SAR 10_76]|nr:hypothetical protein K4K52_005495 [Colletotrichum sp. SAR 10_76]